MGILNRFKKDGLTKPNTPMNPVDRSAWLQWGAPVNVVVGEQHYRDTFIELLGEPRDWGYLQLVPVSFVREPDNEHDPNALKAQLGEFKVGYLRRELAEVYAPVLDTAAVGEFMVAGVVRGGNTHYDGADGYTVQIWPNRLMTRGPTIAVDPSRDSWAKTLWPPFAKEGRPEFDTECAACFSFQIFERPDGLYDCRRCGEVTAGA